MHDLPWLRDLPLGLDEAIAEARPQSISPGKRTLTMSLPGRPADGGQALPATVRADMERGFGADLGSVRVHEGAHVSALGAHAYAQGESLHFAPGQYRPDSEAGRELLGHELTHVLQQRSGRASSPQGKGGAIVRDHGLEREADEVGARVARGEPSGIAAAGGTAPDSGPIQGAFFADGAAANAALELIRAHSTRQDLIGAIAASDKFDVQIEVKPMEGKERGVSGKTMGALFDGGNRRLATFKDAKSELTAEAVRRAATMAVTIQIGTEVETPTPEVFRDMTDANRILTTVHEFERHAVPFYGLFTRIIGVQRRAAAEMSEAEMLDELAAFGADDDAPSASSSGDKSKSSGKSEAKDKDSTSKPEKAEKSEGSKSSASKDSPEQVAADFSRGGYHAEIQHQSPELCGRTAAAALAACAAANGNTAELCMRLYLDTVDRGVAFGAMRDGYLGGGGRDDAAGWQAFAALVVLLQGADRGGADYQPQPGQRVVVVEGFYCGRRGTVYKRVGQQERTAGLVRPEDTMYVDIGDPRATIALPATWCFFLA